METRNTKHETTLLDIPDSNLLEKPVPCTGADDDFDEEEEMARLNALYGQSITVVEEIRKRYYDGGETDSFRDFINDVVYKALEQNEEFRDNVRKLRGRRLSPEETTRVQSKQQALFNYVKVALMETAGIPTEAALSDIELGKKMVQDRLNSSDIDIKSVNDVLRVLGVIHQDENDEKPKFVYPEGLFPNSIDDKWKRYLGAVVNHMRTARDFESGLNYMTKHDVMRADSTRKIAHDSVAKSMDAILGLDKLPESEWDFDKTRRLVDKMREERYPSIDTNEEMSTANAISKALGVEAFAALSILSDSISEIKK